MKAEIITLYSVAALLWIELGWNWYLVYREHAVHSQVKVENIPKMVLDAYAKDRLEEAEHRAYATNRFWILFDSVNAICDSIFLIVRLKAKMWKLSTRFVCRMNLPQSELVVSTVFLTAYYAVEDMVNMPFLIYYTVYMDCGSHPPRINYDKIFRFIFEDHLHTLILPLLFIFWNVPRILIVRKIKRYNFVILWLHSLLLQILLKIGVAEIARIIAIRKCNHHMNDDFYNGLVNITNNRDYLLQNIYVVGQNCTINTRSFNTAYTVGMYKKAIFVSGEMSEQCLGKEGLTNDELLAVVAHELAHWQHEDEWRCILFFTITSFFQFMSLYLLYPQTLVYHTLGFYDEQPVVIGLSTILGSVLRPYNFVVTLLQNIEIRKQETLADIYAARLTSTESLEMALIKISKFNYVSPVDDSLFALFKISHPSLVDRLEVLQNRKFWPDTRINAATR